MIVTYSCISGNYDNKIEDGRLYVEPSNLFVKHRLNAKLPKILPHKCLPEHDYSIWVDSNINLKIKPEELIELFNYPECGVFYHPHRNNINDEIIACKSLDYEERLQYHKDKEGILAMCGIIIRKNCEEVNTLNEKWWLEICLGSSRDQLSFPYTLGTISTYKELQPNVFINNNFFTVKPHKINNRFF